MDQRNQKHEMAFVDEQIALVEFNTKDNLDKHLRILQNVVHSVNAPITKKV